jgi:hypothetical protein
MRQTNLIARSGAPRRCRPWRPPRAPLFPYSIIPPFPSDANRAKQSQSRPRVERVKCFAGKELWSIGHPGVSAKQSQFPDRGLEQAGGGTPALRGAIVQNEPNFAPAMQGPADPIVRNKAGWPPEGVGRGRPTLDQVEGRLHEEPTANRAKQTQFRRSARVPEGEMCGTNPISAIQPAGAGPTTCPCGAGQVNSFEDGRRYANRTGCMWGKEHI